MKYVKSSETIKGLVSVIVASYNHAGYLKQRMDSLINQTYANFEIIVIDDCSPDNSIEILREYEDHPEVSLYIHKKNVGWIETSNEGARIARGEYLIFANCDDFCDIRQLEVLVWALKSNPSCGIAFSRSLMVNEEGMVTGDDYQGRELKFRKHCRNGAFIQGTLFVRFLMHSCVIPNLSGALIKKECFEECGGFSTEFRVCNDWEIFFRFARKYDCVYVFDALNNFRQHGRTIRSTTKDRIQLTEFFQVLYPQIESWDFTGNEKRKFCRRIGELWSYYILSSKLDGLRDFNYHYKVSRQYVKFPVTYLLSGTISMLAGVVVSKFIKTSKKFFEFI